MLAAQVKFNTFIKFSLIKGYSCFSGTSVTVLSKSLQERPARILGIDDFGFLKIQLDDDRIESVHPDGNSFDMLRGLIIPN